MAVFLGALWTLWGAAWLRRVELRREHEPTVRALGLTWAREGWGPSVTAGGEVDGAAVEVRWRRGVCGERVAVRRGGVWELVPDGDVGGRLVG